MNQYTKTYTRENCLLALQVWEEHQTKAIQKRYGWMIPDAVFNVMDGVAEIYYRDDAFPQFEKVIAREIKKNKHFVAETMAWYQEALIPLEKSWKENKALKDRVALIAYYDIAVQGWCGLDISYFVPGMEEASETDKKVAMKMRERAAAYLEDFDRIMIKTLAKLYPKLGDLSKYISIEELKNDKIPAKKILEERAKHYIFFDDEIITGVSFDNFIKEKKLDLLVEKAEPVRELRGQVAMRGSVTGIVRVVMKKENIKTVKAGEILVTAMTTPDYLPAMHKAAAFVTDEGGITCHAAIVARELGKPCVIGTKFATQILKTGDRVEVDAVNGIVTIIK